MILIEEVKIEEKSVGLVVAIDKGIVGYSICNPIEKKFILGRAVEIAIGRARKNRLAVIRLEDIVNGFKNEYERISKGKDFDKYNGRGKELLNILNRTKRVLIKLKDTKKRSMKIL